MVGHDACMDDLEPPLPRAEPLIRPAEPGDVDVLHRFVVELAEAERFPGPGAASRVTWRWRCSDRGRAGIHLDDLYVRPEHRGSGLGRALLGHLAELAVRRGCARLGWWVLRTNEPALRFYRRLRARPLDEIEPLRLDGEPLQTLAATPLAR